MIRKHLSLSQWIIIGAVLGIFVGLFFGESCKIFLPLSNAYSSILEVVVYPYIICTLLGNLGRLSPKFSWLLLKSSWLIYIVLILLVFAILIVLAEAMPVVTTALQITTVQTPQNSKLLELLVPENLFSALANNYVPAVILFCILFGVMLQRVKHEEALFRIFDTISKACIEFWHWMVKLAPLGIFLMLAYTFGTVHISQIKEVMEYLLLFALGVFLLAFWLLPALISALTDIPYRSLMKMLKEPLILAFATKVSILALPYLNDITKKLITQENVKHKETKKIIETVLLISYPLAQLGNFFIYLYMRFASIYYHEPLTATQVNLLPLVTYFSAIGSSHTTGNAVNFLTSFLHFPADATSLFDSLNIITEYGQVLVSVVGFAFLTILITFAYFKKIYWNFKKMFTHVIVVGIILIVLALTLQHLMPNPEAKFYQRISNYTIDKNLLKAVPATFLAPFNETTIVPEMNAEDSLARIKRTGVLRVGYNADARPFVFLNNTGQLVGYDVAMMYKLADSLKVKIEFIPFTWSNLINDMMANQFDIAISGLYVTSSRLQEILFSQPYLELPMALIVPKGHQSEFGNTNEIRSIKNLKVGMSTSPVVSVLADRYLPDADHITLKNFYNYLEEYFNSGAINAAFCDISRCEMWTLGHPHYMTVIPNRFGERVLIGYMVQKNSLQFLTYLNYWLELQDTNGFKTTLSNKWFLGQVGNEREPRWNIWHNLIYK